MHTYGGRCFLSQFILNMHVKKNEAGTLLPTTVMEGITVNVLPNSQHEFLLSTADVGIGYGVSPYSINMTKARHESELVEGKHFVSAITICYSDPKTPHNKVFWTKAGIIRLGFFIRSERAKLFRDWAENLVLAAAEQRAVQPSKLLPAKRRHNRLTSERLLGIMSDVCQIEDKELRTRIAAKLQGGAQW